MKYVEKIEKAGLNYDKIIFEDDFIPGNIHKYQIERIKNRLSRFVKQSFSILEVGCGTGIYTVDLINNFHHVVSTDLSLNAIRNAKTKIPSSANHKVDFIVCEGSKIPLKEDSIDMTLITGVLHHIPEKISECIYNISRITRKQIFFDEPNKILLWYIIMKLSDADPVGNERPLDAFKVITDLKKNGFDIVSISYWGFLAQIALLFKANFATKFLERSEDKLEKLLGRRFYFRWTITAKKNS